MPDHLQDLLDTDTQAQSFFASLPLFIRDQLLAGSTAIHSREDLSAAAGNAMTSALRLEQYAPLFDDAGPSDIDK